MKVDLEERLRAVLAAKAAEVDRRPLPPLEQEVVMTLEPAHPVPERSGWRRWSAVAGVAAALLLVVGVVLFVASPDRAAVPDPIPPADEGVDEAVEDVDDAVIGVPQGCADGGWGVLLTRGTQSIDVIGAPAPPAVEPLETWVVPAGAAALHRFGTTTMVVVELADGTAVQFGSATVGVEELRAMSESVRGTGAESVVPIAPPGFRSTAAACGVG